MKHKVAFALIMGSITTGIISFTLLSLNKGFNPGFLSIWLRSWGLAYIVVIPAILFLSPKVLVLVDFIFGKKE